MTLLLQADTRVMVQGITGNQGAFHTQQMLEYGTNIVAGVSPGMKQGEIHGVSVYPDAEQAVRASGAEVSVLFVPAPYAMDAAMEAIYYGIRLVVLIAEHIPVRDTIQILAYAKTKGATVVGPNTFGLVASGKSKVGIMPNRFFVPGPVGVISRSGTLCYEIVGALKKEEIGTSTVIGLGGDQIVGLEFLDGLQALEEDEDTQVIVLVGEIGGSAEEKAAAFVKDHIKKPVVAFLAGKSAPLGKRMGHAGAIIERGTGTFDGKIRALKEADIPVAETPSQLPQLVKEIISSGPFG